MFIFGTQYLRGFTPKMDDWEKDLYNIRQAGFNTIRAWLIWGVLEKSEGQIDYGYIDRLLELARKNELKVGFLFHLHGCPEWAVKKYPQYYYVSSKGIPFEPSQRANTPSGGWPGLCYDHAEVQEMETRFITQIVKHFACREEIAFWEPMNEPHLFTDHTCRPVEIYCYCEATRERFRQWLKNKYDSIQALNHAWGRYHNNFDEVRPPTWRFGYADYMDWRLFCVDNVYAEIERRAKAIRQHDDKPVIAHSWGGGSINCPQLAAMAFDDWKNSQLFDKWGYSAFPSEMNQSLMIGLGTDACRNASNGKEMWQSELGSGDLGFGLDRAGRVSKETLAAWTWESIRHGAKGVLYWQYRKEIQGSEFNSCGLTTYNGDATENLKEASRICTVLQNNDSIFNKASTVEAQVGLLFSLRSYFTDWFSHRNNDLAIDCLSGYYRMFWEENIPVDILHEDHIATERMKQYKLTIIPNPWALSINARRILKEYVEQGGCILSDPYFCPFDNDMALDTSVPGGGFDSIFGCYEDDIVQNSSVDIIYKQEQLSFSGNYFSERFILNGGKAVASYIDGTPVIVENDYANGKAIISGINLGLCYSPRTGVGDDIIRNEKMNISQKAKNIVMDIALSMGINPPLSCDNPAIKVSILLNSSDMTDLLIAMNFTDKLQNAAVRLAIKYEGINPIYNDGMAKLDVDCIKMVFKPYETIVFELMKQMNYRA